MLELDWQAIMESVERRNKLSKNPPRCPMCETRQVQLLEWEALVTWRCRHCRHEWSVPV